MSTNKDLLKQAIAEAKTIREAAIANAKEALEESLTPHIKEMLAQKLQEMDDMDEEEVMDENIYEAEEEEVEAEEGAEEEGEEGEEEDIKIEDMSVEDLKDLIRGIVAQETGAEEGMEDELPADDLGAEDMTGMEDGEEEIDINELLAELEEGVDEYTSAPTDRGTSHKDTGKELDTQMVDAIKSIAKKTGKSYEAISQLLFGGKKATPAEFEEGVQQDLQEALKTVNHLRKQLQEVNLLNAKLLYVNKVFKASNLTEVQKVNVVAAFDKAETVKEVKLVFETVSKNVVAKQPVKAAIKEHKSFASKPAGSTQKQVINEVSEAVNRMQILAGIIPRQY